METKIMQLINNFVCSLYEKFGEQLDLKTEDKLQRIIEITEI